MSDSTPKKPTVKPSRPGSGMVFDVSRPGRAPVSSTSKPIIVGHKPQVRDPFTTGRTSDEHSLLSTKQKVHLQPTDETAPKPESQEKPVAAGAATAELAAVAAELSAQPETHEEEPNPVPTPAPKPELKPTAHEESTSTSTLAEEKDPEWEAEKTETVVAAATSPVLPPELATKKQIPLSPELKQALEAAVHADQAPGADPKGVIVSDGHGAFGIWKILAWLVAVIVLVVVVGDLLLDAGTITTSVSIPHTHFIK